MVSRSISIIAIVTLTAVSRAPLAKINAHKKRMGWSFPWVSSYGSDFNFDYHVSFTPEQIAEGKAYYNYEVRPNTVSDEQGISVFYKNERGEVFHTYSCYARGIDMVNGAYHFLDLVPKGRDWRSCRGPWRGYGTTTSTATEPVDFQPACSTMQ